MWGKIKSLFAKVEDTVERKVITEDHVLTLVNDFFSILHAGVLFTPSVLDDEALKLLESHIDKGVLVSVLTSRLRDLINFHD